MNRSQEYEQLLQALDETVPDLGPAVERAHRRRNRNRHLFRPLGGLAAVFALFVALVNYSLPVAHACAQIPILRELAEAVTFSRSLRDAVEHEYVQPINLSQTKNGITAQIDSLIVDQKQVNLFFHLDSDQYDQLCVDPVVLDVQGQRPGSCSYGLQNFEAKNGELRHMNVDFLSDSVPDQLRLQLKVYQDTPWPEDQPPDLNPDPWDIPTEEPTYLAEFDFLLQFDPQFTASGQIVPIQTAVELDGQSITIPEIEISPSHIRVNVSEDPRNTARLERLDFYIEADNGMKFFPVSNGVTATGTLDSPNMTSYRADSSYFYQSDHLTLVITGARWLDRDQERLRLNLNTGTGDPLPRGVTFYSVEPYGQGWTVSFLAPLEGERTMAQVFHTFYYDPQGVRHEADSYSSAYFEAEGSAGRKPTHFIQSFPLRDYPYDEVWLCPVWNRSWTAEEPVVVPVR